MSSPTEPEPPPEPPDGFDVLPFTGSCRRVFERGEHALIGISAGNSYFSQQRIARLLCWARDRFARVDVLYTDLHLDAMYMASGSSREHAAVRANRTLRDVRRRIRRAVETAAAESAAGADVRVLALSQCTRLPGYREVERRLDREYAADPRIRRCWEEHVRRVVGTQPDPEGARLRAGLAYLRAELPFLLSTPEVLEVPSSVSCYHDLLPILSALRGVTSCFHPGQAHVVVRPALRCRTSPEAEALASP
ncbi:tRNA-dependent cyclodipeptide synthase [Nocardiopsis sp. HUAS JQ3]|uniref:tRNA-dependent cyclodipeptide synthase n=1 Tax=Nocardiopsis sp. HUAS JQ3 TaxID=3061629 RepID=UPI0023A9F3D7|nr:tRNA-dependent cyclodipeptide synthase [Nocardiopsis sp. HUAS JQ3]WDZ92900.1 tRNA-dependent cyclodipeptide synthase [Nocardiopsis sp. HUAS JQ3]